MSNNDSQESSDQQTVLHSTSTPRGLSQSTNSSVLTLATALSQAGELVLIDPNNEHEGVENDNVVTILPSLDGVFECSWVELCIIDGKLG